MYELGLVVNDGIVTTFWTLIATGLLGTFGVLLTRIGTLEKRNDDLTSAMEKQAEWHRAEVNKLELQNDTYRAQYDTLHEFNQQLKEENRRLSSILDEKSIGASERKGK